MTPVAAGGGGLLGSAVGMGSMGASIASVAAGAAGGAAGGFVSGVSLAAMNGQHLGAALQAGLKGAEYGAIEGGITAGEGMLNGKGDLLEIKGLPGPDDVGRYLAIIAARGVEGAIANTLENKNASLGFWSGTLSGIGGMFSPPQGADPFGGPALWGDFAKGVLGGLGSMNKHGKGFMTGFWTAEATALSSAVDTGLKKTYPDDIVGNDIVGVAAKGVLSGAAARFGFKTFSSGLFTGAGSEFLQDILPNQMNPEKPLSLSGAVNSGFNLLQPKVTKKGVTYPLNSISGGTWGRGASWAQLFAPQVTGN